MGSVGWAGSGGGGAAAAAGGGGGEGPQGSASPGGGLKTHVEVPGPGGSSKSFCFLPGECPASGRPKAVAIDWETILKSESATALPSAKRTSAFCGWTFTSTRSCGRSRYTAPSG